MNVSFGAGKIFYPGTTKEFAKPAEVKKIKEYAKDNECDVVLLNRGYYIGGEGSYDALVIENWGNGTNKITRAEFDFGKLAESFVKLKETL